MLVTLGCQHAKLEWVVRGWEAAGGCALQRSPLRSDAKPFQPARHLGATACSVAPPPTFSPESLPTTRMSSPTAAACGARGISAAAMNWRRLGSNRMNPKSCTAGGGKGRSRHNEPQREERQRHVVNCSNMSACNCRLHLHAPAPDTAPAASPRRCMHIQLAEAHTWIVIQRLHRHLLSVQKDGLGHHRACKSGVRGGSAVVPRTHAWLFDPATWRNNRFPACHELRQPACARKQASRLLAAPGVTTWRLVRIRPRALSTTNLHHSNQMGRGQP